MFETDQFIADCRAALKESSPEMAVREVIARAVEHPANVMSVLGEPVRAGIFTLHRSDELTVINLVWGPEMDLMPHDHAMWAAIGIYTGKEINTFWRRSEENGLEQLGSKEMTAREAVWLGDSAIHSVRNPLAKLTGAIHVYGGDFFDADRHEWDPDTLEEAPYDVEKAKRMFEESNVRLLSAL